MLFARPGEIAFQEVVEPLGSIRVLKGRRGKVLSFEEGGVNLADLSAEQLERPRVGAERGNRKLEEVPRIAQAEDLDLPSRLQRQAGGLDPEMVDASRRLLLRERRAGILEGRRRCLGDCLHGFRHSRKSGEIGAKDFVSFPDPFERAAQEGRVELSVDPNRAERQRRPLRVPLAQAPEQSLLRGKAKSFEDVRAHGAGAAPR